MLRKAFQLLVFTFLCGAASAGIYEDFFAALGGDDPKAVQRILSQGFEVNSPNPQGQHALHLTARSGSLRMLRALLAFQGIKVDAPNAADETPLMLAALRGDLDLCQTLLQHGAQVSRTGWSPLHYAAAGPSVSVVGFLLELGAPIDAPSPNGTSPLMMAARYGSEESVRLLLSRGANAGLRNQLKLGAADFARLAGREELARRLESLLR